MRIFKQCPMCGATLDPGESCDCGEEKSTAPRDSAETVPSSKGQINNADSISDSDATVKREIPMPIEWNHGYCYRCGAEVSRTSTYCPKCNRSFID
jgi:predicted amidophosphoribosyltransferase